MIFFCCCCCCCPNINIPREQGRKRWILAGCLQDTQQVQPLSPPCLEPVLKVQILPQIHPKSDGAVELGFALSPLL